MEKLVGISVEFQENYFEENERFIHRCLRKYSLSFNTFLNRLQMTSKTLNIHESKYFEKFIFISADVNVSRFL